jgi:DNA-binding NarL/FixJ family response regulator
MDGEHIRILIADDHPLFRDGMRGLLESVGDVDVIGEATTGEEVLALGEQLQPDVVLMDIKMPGIDGIEATRRLLQTSPHIAVLVVTMFEDDNSVFAAMQAGARGYLLKGANQAQTLRAIRSVASGEAIFSPAIAERLIGFFATTPKHPAPIFPELTEREREILALIAEGHSNHEIADGLYLSLKTVRNHVSNIFSKLQVADRAQAAIRAREVGLRRSPGVGSPDVHSDHAAGLKTQRR